MVHTNLRKLEHRKYVRSVLYTIEEKVTRRVTMDGRFGGVNIDAEDKLTVSHDNGGTRQERAELLFGGYVDERHFDDRIVITKVCRFGRGMKRWMISKKLLGGELASLSSDDISSTNRV